MPSPPLFAQIVLLYHTLPEKKRVKRRFTDKTSCGTLPSVDKSKHGFGGHKSAHTASSPLAIRQVLPAGLSLSGHISAPTKLLAPVSDVFSSGFQLLRRRRADARQEEKDKKRRKDTLTGVLALTN
ncbi:MAG: hypothetical protein ACLVGP_10395 [Oscillospiraceae bacterium]